MSYSSHSTVTHLGQSTLLLLHHPLVVGRVTTRIVRRLLQALRLALQIGHALKLALQRFEFATEIGDLVGSLHDRQSGKLPKTYVSDGFIACRGGRRRCSSRRHRRAHRVVLLEELPSDRVLHFVELEQLHVRARSIAWFHAVLAENRTSINQ